MTINTLDFSTWFSTGCYGGLACCMLAIAANALYTTLRQRGTTRQLAAVIVICVLAALLLLPAIIWFNLRFSVRQGQLAFIEIEIMLLYVAFCGWFLPLGATSTYCLLTQPRDSLTAMRLPRAAKTQLNGKSAQQQSIPPRYQPGAPIPFVYGDDTPWGWLEYRSGNFQGQRLALKRMIITIGRDEANEIWLDDEMASRYHAELAWHAGSVFLTDCESLNGVFLNGERIRQNVLISSNDLLEIGSHRFAFFLETEPRKHLDDGDDPLLHHKWRSALDSLTAGSDILPATRPLSDRPVEDKQPSPIEDEKALADSALKQTEEVDRAAPLALLPDAGGALVIRSGSKAGQSFRLSRPVLTVGRGIESDVIINDASISRRHVQFSRQLDGDYIQDLVSRNGTRINGELITSATLLQPGDMIEIGNLSLEYTQLQSMQTTPLAMDITPPPKVTGPISGVGLAPLRLPSRQKEE
jgi:pSer/pThr/pTyr-binding forkhead associated (FHA) protein